MNKKLQKWLSYKLQILIKWFIVNFCLEIVKDLAVRFVKQFTKHKLKKLYNNKIERIVYALITAIHIILSISQSNIPMKFSVPFSIESYFLYKSILQELVEEVTRRRHSGISKLFNNKVKIVKVIKDKNTGTKEFVIHSFVPRNKVLKDIEEIEHYLNTNVIETKLDNYNKRKFSIITSKNKISKKLDNSTLENRLINILNEFGFNANFIKKDENDFFVNVYIDCNIDVKKVTGKLKDIAYKLKLDSNKLNIRIEPGVFVFQIKKEDQALYFFSDYIDNIKIPNNLEIPFTIGIHKQSNECIVEDIKRLQHLLIVGQTGSGKSCTLNNILQSWLYLKAGYKTQFIMYDFKGTELDQYKNFSNVTFMTDDIDALINSLKELDNELSIRYELFRKSEVKDIFKYNKKNKNKIPYITLVIDEFAEILLKHSKDKKAEIINDLLASMINRCRAAGIYFIFALQKHTGDEFDIRVRSQMKTEFLHVFDNKDKKGLMIPVDVQNLKPGEFYLKSVFHKYLNFQGLFIDDEKEENNKIYHILKKKYEISVHNKEA
jgi:ABC-type dipeptide/oligopeptide/nickel transport system ATPase component